jgi:hypothetical protein
MSTNLRKAFEDDVLSQFKPYEIMNMTVGEILDMYTEWLERRDLLKND